MITDDRVKKTMEDYADSLAGFRVKKSSVQGSETKSRFGSKITQKMMENPYTNYLENNAPGPFENKPVDEKEDIQIVARRRFNNSSLNH